MIHVIPLEGAALDRVLDLTHPVAHDSLDRQAYGRFHAAQRKTAWGSRHQRAYALVEGGDLLACASSTTWPASSTVDPCASAASVEVFTNPTQRGAGHVRALLRAMIEAARTGDGAPSTDPVSDERDGFDAMHVTEATLQVEESVRHGAPMTMVRGGEERDLAAIVAMGRVRAQPFRFHLDRDIDLVQYAITRKRLLAGLGAANARQLHFFIAEEGTTAAAYVVVSIAGDMWTLEECGDRDASGARVGALLQALIAREPVQRRPTIRGWLPPRFLPPGHGRLGRAFPGIMVQSGLNSIAMPRLSGDDVVYWRRLLRRPLPIFATCDHDSGDLAIVIHQLTNSPTH